MATPKCLFSYYGGKSKIAHHYPAPAYSTIIEPFAGGASYSLRYADRDVIINDLNRDVARLWRWLIETPVEDVLRAIPESVEIGQRFDGDSPADLFCRANANQGTFGGTAERRQVTWFGARDWHRVRPKLEYFLPRIRHWRVENMPYTALPDVEATWFIDPPYANDAGRTYREHEIDYQELADWCRSRRGQVIVCENDGADWLPFRPLTVGWNRRGSRAAVEAVWTNVT